MGCSKGKNKCKFAHVKMCESSVRTRGCNQGSDCKLGYHIEGTKLTTPALISPINRQSREEFPALHNSAKPSTNSNNKKQNLYNQTLGIRSQLLNNRPIGNYRDIVSNKPDNTGLTRAPSYFQRGQSHSHAPQNHPGTHTPPPPQIPIPQVASR